MRKSIMTFPPQLHHVEIIIGQPDSTDSLAGTGQPVSFSRRQGLDILNLLGGIFFQRKESVQSKLRDVSGVIALDF